MIQTSQLILKNKNLPQPSTILWTNKILAILTKREICQPQGRN
jgi:hypothetical protein